MNRRRHYADATAKGIVIGGGIGVLLTLLLIFCYLLYVTLPLMNSPSVTTQTTIVFDDNQPDAVLWDDFQLSLFYQYPKTPTTENDKTLLLGQQSVVVTNRIHQLPAISQPQIVLDWSEHAINVNHEDIQYVLPESIMVEASIDLSKNEQGVETLLMDARTTEKYLGVVVTVHQKVLFVKFERDTGRIVSVWHDHLDSPFDQVLMSTRLNHLFFKSGDELSIYHATNTKFQLLYSVTLSTFFEGHKVKYLKPIGESLVMVTDHNVVSLWSEIALSDRHTFQQLNQWNTSLDIAFLQTNSKSGVIVIADKNGLLEGYHVTDREHQWSAVTSIKDLTLVSLNDSADGLVAINQNTLEYLSIDNPHPDVSFSSLFDKVWYPGYPEPDYVWQSNSVSDGQVSRFSLVPLTVGTLKITLIAIILAIPIAVSAAVYSAFFMSPSMRSVVKPTIEMVEALPTVVLGFIAGLWLAPLFEAHFLSILLVIVGLPIGILVTMFLLSRITIQQTSMPLQNLLPWLLIPLILALVALSFSQARHLEVMFFDGDILHWIYLKFGITYQQRNALVVGLLMGFAIIPTIYTLSEEAISGVPKHLASGALALGASHWQAVTRVVLITASPGILAAVMIGFGRAVGETMVVLMATGNMPLIDTNILNGVRTLTANIAIEIPESNVASSHYRVLFLSALLLLSITFILNSIAEVIRQQMRKKYSEL